MPEISDENAVSSAKPAFVEHLTSSRREAAENGVPEKSARKPGFAAYL